MFKKDFNVMDSEFVESTKGEYFEINRQTTLTQFGGSVNVPHRAKITANMAHTGGSHK